MRWLWDRQSVWSQAANHAKRSIGRARTAGLALGVGAACAGTAATQVMAVSGGAGKTLAFLAAVAVGLMPLAAKKAGPQQIRDWTRLRSVSEELKSEAYTYLAGVAPYQDADSARVLLDHAERVIADASDLAGHTSGLAPRQRVLPAVTDIGSYVDVRVVDQIEKYYWPRAADMGRRTRQVRRAELALAAAAVVLGGASGVFGAGWASAWVATVTTVAGAVTAHAAASRYAYQELEFSRTAAELERLVARRAPTANADPTADGAFVSQCERIISAQNEGWMAKWLAE